MAETPLYKDNLSLSRTLRELGIGVAYLRKKPDSLDFVPIHQIFKGSACLFEGVEKNGRQAIDTDTRET